MSLDEKVPARMAGSLVERTGREERARAQLEGKPR